jgi:hypothetical protein
MEGRIAHLAQLLQVLPKVPTWPQVTSSGAVLKCSPLSAVRRARMMSISVLRAIKAARAMLLSEGCASSLHFGDFTALNCARSRQIRPSFHRFVRARTSPPIASISMCQRPAVAVPVSPSHVDECARARSLRLPAFLAGHGVLTELDKSALIRRLWLNEWTEQITQRLDMSVSGMAAHRTIRTGAR